MSQNLKQPRSLADQLQAFAKTRLCILQDDTTPGARAVLVAPAQNIGVETTNRMVSLSRGLVFVAISSVRAEAFLLEPMKNNSSDSRYPNALVSVDAREGITTGISAADRARAIELLGAPYPDPRTLVKPGHIVPVSVRRGGVLVRNALPEGACDLALQSGATDAAVFMDLLTQDGRLLNEGEQQHLSASEKIPLIKLSELVHYRLGSEMLVQKIAEAALPTRSGGELRSFVYKSHLHEGEHLALVKGTISPDTVTLTRVTTEQTFSDVFGGPGHNSRKYIQQALTILDQSPVGVLVYLRRPMHGALADQLLGHSTSPGSTNMALMRSYGLGAQILRDLGVRKIELLSNTEQHLLGLDTFGLEIVSQRPLAAREHRT